MAVKAPRTSCYVEVERKFDIAESTVSPSFEGIAGVVRVEKSPIQALDAVYFDTPGHDLAANRVTLRRRTGGPDAGWHLKLPAGPDARTEIRAPLDEGGEDGVPGELLDMVLAIVRDRPLAPVARITTRRESQVLYGAEGTALAEFCNDQVTASSAGASDEVPAEQQWREWELELLNREVAADPELLDRLSNRLLDAGAAPAGHGSKLARVLGTPSPPNGAQVPTDPLHRAVAAHVQELLLWDRAVRVNADDAVHQMRVTIRKIRSLLRDSRACGLPDPTGILGELRQLAGVLGSARDAEVLAQRYQRALDQLPPELVHGRVRERLVDGAQRRYQAGLRRSLIALRSPRYFRLLDALDALVAEPPAIGFGQESAPVTVDAAYRGVRKAAHAAARAGDEQQNEALHRIRKRAKRLRYTAAATGTTQVSEQAKAVQTLLGDHQDSVVSRAHLVQQAEAARAAGEDTFTYGLLYQQEADLACGCRERLAGALRKLGQSVRKARGGRVGL